MLAIMPSLKKPRHEVSSCSSLPPEIWINIFSYHTDLAHLWNHCRRVSPTLRGCADYAFAEHFMRAVHIDFQLEKYNLGGKSKRPEVPVAFDRLGKGSDKEVAWFRDKRPMSEVGDGSTSRTKKQYDKIIQRWEENVRLWKPQMPNYIISIQGIVNDTALPGLEIDIEAREIRFEWRKMLQFFYREHERQQVLKDVWQTKFVNQIRTNHALLAKGERLMPSDYPPSWANAEAEIRKDVRRARLKESYSDDEQMVWAIDSLKHFENYGAASGNPRSLKLDPDLPGAGLGERWFGSVNLVKELYLDEWNCMHRIDTKAERIRTGT